MADWYEGSDTLLENLKNAYRLSRDEALLRVSPSTDLAQVFRRMYLDFITRP